MIHIDLAESTVLVTGATGGLGGAIVRGFLAAGAAVVAHGRTDGEAQRGASGRRHRGRVSWSPDVRRRSPCDPSPAGTRRVPMAIVDNTVDVAAPPAAVWARIIDPQGFNDEMWPWLTMRMPRGAAGLTLETLDLERPVGRAWLRWFGIIPVDFDHLTIVELQPGVRFLERSTMASMRRWEHERTLTPIPAGTCVCDRVTLQPRWPITGVVSPLSGLVDHFFQHRQRRLQAHFAPTRAAGRARRPPRR